MRISNTERISSGITTAERTPEVVVAICTLERDDILNAGKERKENERERKGKDVGMNQRSGLFVQIAHQFFQHAVFILV